jgi:hypothetical protein
MPISKDLKDLDSQLKKTVISAESFKRGGSFDLSKNIASIHKNIGSLAEHTRKLVMCVSQIEKTVNNNSRKITSLKNISKTQSERISGTNIGAKLPGSSTSKVEDNISAIAKSVNSIAEIMAGKKKLADDTAAYDRKKAEQEKRGLAESKLEKVFRGIAKTAEKVIAPVKSLLDRILDFIGTVILGRIVFKLVEWLGDKKNQSKVKSIIRFFKDWGPTLLSLYIVFGTSFGKFARGLISLVIKSTVRLGAAVAALAVKAGIGKAGGKLSKVAGFLGGKKGKLLAAGLEAGVTVAGTMALSNTLKGGEQPKAQGLAGGGYVRPRFPAFSGGGFNFKGMMGGAGMGAMFGPLGMLLGGVFGGSSGLINGPGGPKGDKIPAMLSDGEFVMSAGAVQKYGVDTFEAMNAAGGGTNIPKIASGIVRAAGGGYIGNPVVAQEAWTNYMKMNPSKFAKGADYGDFESVNRASRDFMKTFMKTGKPPEWAKVTQKTTRVNAPPRSSQTSPPRSSQTTPPRSTPPNTSSSSLMRRPTSALSTDVRSPGIRSVRPRGYGGALQAAFAAMEFNDRKQAGQTTAQAGLGATGSALGGQVGWMAGAKAGALLGGAIGAMFGGVGAAPGAAVGAIVGGIAGGFGGASLGGKLADDVSGVNAAKERMSRGGIGGAIKGGFGLKKESAKDQFKNAPKTMVMTDDNGRPFVGHKAMKNGQLTYVRPSKPGTGTTNPLEMLGRMINPGAYKDSDARLAMKNQKIAMVNALERFQAQGMAPDAQARMMKKLGGNLKDVQNDLNYRKKTQAKLAPTKPKTAGSGVTPPVKPAAKVVYGPPAPKAKNKRGGGTTKTKTPNFGATCPKNGNQKRKILGIF